MRQIDRPEPFTDHYPAGGKESRLNSDLQVVGWNYRTCPLALRERLTMVGRAVPRFLRHFRHRFPATEVVLLSTCNRLELYFVADRTESVPTHEQAIATLAEFQQVPPGEIVASVYGFQRDQAFRHLLSVAASLDSMILGESQILRQVKRAYQIARDESCAGPMTHRVFQAAIRSARRVARETNLFRHRVSIPRLAIRGCARQILGSLRDRRVAILGAGEMAIETLRVLQDERVADVVVLSRNADKSQSITAPFHVATRPWPDVPWAFGWAELIISATSAPTPLFSPCELRQWIAKRHQSALVILDLGVPRDIDPHVASLPGVYLYSIEDLRDLADRNRRRREMEIPQAWRIIEEESARFDEQLRGQSVGAFLQQLQSIKNQAQQEELLRLLHRFPDLDEEVRCAIRRALHRLAGKLMHPLVTAAYQGHHTTDPRWSAKPLNSAR